MKIKAYLNESPVFVVNALYESVIADVNRQLRDDDVNLLQGLILTALLFEDHASVTPSKLAEVFSTSRGNISHAVSHLESERLLKRRVDESDARRFHLVLTPEGKKAAQRLIKFFDSLQGKIETALGITECRRIVTGLRGLERVLKT